MRMESQERRYQQMVKGAAPVAKLRSQEPGEHQQGLQFATNFATQVIVAFIGAFLLGYFFVETFVAPESFTAKVIAGAFCSFFTLLMETCLLVVHEQKKEMIEQKERERDDRKKRLPVVRASSAQKSPQQRSQEQADQEAKPKPLSEKKED
mmetsp:Transcript_7219/g.14912  ORF Transcript_7219/g.14912 Transcript_7219/m.14912 type:complete len:151 (+) Transcript_7219:90-542(+)